MNKNQTEIDNLEYFVQRLKEWWTGRSEIIKEIEERIKFLEGKI